MTSGFVPQVPSATPFQFPLTGEWAALNTPAERIPSHGTDYFGQRYAFDFVRLNSTGEGFYEQPVWKHLVSWLSAQNFLAWNQPVLAAFPGRVVSACDGWLDRLRINAVWEIVRASLFTRPPPPGDYRPLLGNYLLVAGTVGVALYAHLRDGSLRVSVGDEVDAGQELARVGNSGNSTMPHLHFHVMDGPDLNVASVM